MKVLEPFFPFAFCGNGTFYTDDGTKDALWFTCKRSTYAIWKPKSGFGWEMYNRTNDVPATERLKES